MSLTAFNRLRRLQQVEAMKPENIAKPKEEVKEVVEEKVAKIEAPTTRRTRRN